MPSTFSWEYLNIMQNFLPKELYLLASLSVIRFKWV